MYVSHSTQQLIELDNGFAFIAFLEHVSYPVSLLLNVIAYWALIFLMALGRLGKSDLMTMCR